MRCEREHFYDDITQVLQNTKKGEPTLFSKLHVNDSLASTLENQLHAAQLALVILNKQQ